ncbi:MAG: putative collagen-binding domain-containing protein [Chloroflexota bacterium]
MIESRPFLSRIPDQTLISTPEGDPSKYVVVSRDSEGGYALIYIPTARQTITVNLASLSGARFRVWWFDPQTGAATVAETFERCASKSFTSPQNGIDWVLVIDAVERGFSAPGMA